MKWNGGGRGNTLDYSELKLDEKERKARGR
jgi:hypothetical protein